MRISTRSPSSLLRSGRQEVDALAPLPEARSSHDAVVIGDKLYVVGGWTLSGDRKGNVARHGLGV